MNDVSIAIQMAQCQLLGRHREMAKAIDLLSIRAALGGVDLQVIEIGAASTRKEKARRVMFELEMLHIVIVASQIEMYTMLAE